jgi:hypothetical protein
MLAYCVAVKLVRCQDVKLPLVEVQGINSLFVFVMKQAENIDICMPFSSFGKPIC